VPASGSALTNMRGTPNRLPASIARAAHASRGRSAGYDAGRIAEARGSAIQCCARQKSPRASVSSATMTSSTSTMSAMLRVWGTTTSIVGTSGQLPRVEIIPRDGVYAHRALFDAGARPLDHVSSASPNAAKLAAVAVPDPFDEPEPSADVR